MQQLVQSAIEAANHGNKAKAMELIKQALTAAPNDVNAWLVLAAIVEESDRKRQCLNRVLKLDPANTIARDELLQMDRVALGARPSQPIPAPVSTVPPQAVPAPAPITTQPPSPAPQERRQDVQKLKPSAKGRSEKPLVFKYPIWMRLAVYFFLAIFGCFGLAILVQEPLAGLPVLGLFLLTGLSAWIVSARVEVNEAGIRVSRMLTSSQVGWNEIARIKSNSMQQNLQLITRQGKPVKVTSQVSGYPRIVEILRQKRPDLFGMPASSDAPAGFGASASTSAGTPAFTGAKTFRKRFIAQYGSYLLTVPFCLISVWTIFTDEQYMIGAAIAAVVCVFLMIAPLLQVSAVKVEPNRIVIETMFEEKEFSARQIADIKMQSVRGRGGRVTNYVNVQPVEGKNYPLQGFSDGDELIYGFLTNWWNSYRNR